MVLTFLNLLINLAEVYTDPNFSATLGSYHHGLIPINGLSTMDIMPVSCILSNSSFNLSDRAVWVCLWNSHLERFRILFECDNVAVLHDAQSTDQL